MLLCFMSRAAVRSWLVRRKIQRSNRAASVIQSTWRKWRVRFGRNIYQSYRVFFLIFNGSVNTAQDCNCVTAQIRELDTTVYFEIISRDFFLSQLKLSFSLLSPVSVIFLLSIISLKYYWNQMLNLSQTTIKQQVVPTKQSDWDISDVLTSARQRALRPIYASSLGAFDECHLTEMKE